MLREMFKTLAFIYTGTLVINENTIAMAFEYAEEITIYLINSLLNWVF